MAARWIVFLFYTGLVGLLAWRLLRRARAAWRSRSESAAGKTGIRLFVFAVLSLFFAGAVKQVLISGARLVGRAFVAVPFQLVTDAQLGEELERSDVRGDLSAALSFVAYGVRDAVRAAHLAELPYARMVAFAALFLILTKLLFFASTPEEAHNAWLKKAWDAVGVRRRQNTYLGVVLLGAAYLSAAALMALPELDSANSVPESVSVEKLRERLTAMQMSSDEMAQVYPEKVQDEDPFVAVTALLEKPPQPVLDRRPDGQPDPTGSPDASSMVVQRIPVIVQVESDAAARVATGRARRADLGNLWRDMRAETQTIQRQSLDQALLSYENENLNRMGVRQTIEHFRQVVDWYQRRVVESRALLAACQTAVQGADKAFAEWSERAGNALRRAYVYGDKEGRGGETYAVPELTDTAAAADACRREIPPEVLPRRAEAGANLKPVFRAVGGWLIGQESLQLALIVGMIGFGLLGAAISSIVRGRREGRAAGEPLVSNLAAMVIRGVSAAVVVFLAVKGGLALFGASDMSVNPYVVLLTCFGAAVFSQDAWARVRKNWAGGEPPPPAGGEPPPPTPTDVPPPPANG